MKKVLLTLGVLALTSFSAQASIDSLVNEYNYDLMSQNVSDVTSGNAININGVNVSVSAFSDTSYEVSTESQRVCNFFYCFWKKRDVVSDTDIVETADTTLVKGWGYGVRNNLEPSGSSHQTVDNVGEYVNGELIRSFDYLLFSFDKDVNLTDIDFGWNNGDDQQVSVVSLDNASALTGDSWDKLVSNETTLNAVSNSFNIVGGQYDGTVQLTGFETTYSNYWLVGAYNKAFGDINGHDDNDAFKISGIQFNTLKSIKEPPPKVSEPGILFIMSIGAGIALYRRRRSD